MYYILEGILFCWKMILYGIIAEKKCNDQIIVTASEFHGFQMDYTAYKSLYLNLCI